MNFKRFAAAVSAFAVMLLGLLLLAGCAPRGEDKGGDALARIQAKGEITVALEGTWSPWGYHDQSGELVGKTLVAIVNLPPRKMMGLDSCGMLISAVHTEKGEERLHLLMVDDAIPAGAKLC